MIVLLGLISFALMLGVFAIAASVGLAYQRYSGATVYRYSQLAQKYALAYTEAETDIPGLSDEQTIVRSIDSQNSFHTAWRLQETPYCSSLKGDISSHHAAIYHFIFATSPTKSGIGSFFGGGRYGGGPRYCSTRITVDGLTRYMALQENFNLGPYGIEVAPAVLVGKILEELKTDGTSETFAIPTQCMLYGSALGITFSYISFFDSQQSIIARAA